MCDCDSNGAPSCWRATNRRARKPHRCVECNRTIAIGETYEYVSGVWDGRGDDFKTCLRCVVLREAHVKAEEQMQRDEIDARRAREHRGATLMGAADGSPWMPAPSYRIEQCTPTIGEIIPTISECIREDRRYVQHFRVARRALLAEEKAR